MPSDSRPAERNPIDAVIVSPSATPSWPQPGGRYSMSPGSSNHSRRSERSRPGSSAACRFASSHASLGRRSSAGGLPPEAGRRRSCRCADRRRRHRSRTRTSRRRGEHPERNGSRRAAGAPHRDGDRLPAPAASNAVPSRPAETDARMARGAATSGRPRAPPDAIRPHRRRAGRTARRASRCQFPAASPHGSAVASSASADA